MPCNNCEFHKIGLEQAKLDIRKEVLAHENDLLRVEYLLNEVLKQEQTEAAFLGNTPIDRENLIKKMNKELNLS